MNSKDMISDVIHIEHIDGTNCEIWSCNKCSGPKLLPCPKCHTYEQIEEYKKLVEEEKPENIISKLETKNAALVSKCDILIKALMFYKRDDESAVECGLIEKVTDRPAAEAIDKACREKTEYKLKLNENEWK